MRGKVAHLIETERGTEMLSKTKIIFAGIALAGLSACTQPEPEAIGIQPTFDKYGNAYCPEGYVLDVDICLPISAVPGAIDTDGDGIADTMPDANGDVPDDGDGQGNNNRNTENTQNQNNNRNQGG